MWKFGDSFDHYATADLSKKYTFFGAGGGSGTRITNGAGRDGTNAVEFYNSNGALGRAIVTSRPTAIVGFGWKGASLNGGAIHSLWDGVNVRGQVTYVAHLDGSISAWRVAGNNSFMGYALSTRLGITAPGIIFANVYHFLEFKTTIDASAGICQVKVDGDLVLDLSGVNTRNSEASGNSYTMLGVGGCDGFGGSAFIDEMWMIDDQDNGDGCHDFLGDLIAEALFVTGPGSSAQFTPLSGTNASQVLDPVPDDDATYVYSSTIGNKDLYAHGPLVRIGANIVCVQQVTTGKKTTGASRAITHVIKTEGAEHDNGTLYLPTIYDMQVTAQPLNPTTGITWTVAEVNASLIGQKVTV